MISLYDLIEASNGQLFGEPAAQLFDDFCLDPTDAIASTGKNLLFVALHDEHGDTHQFIGEAIENGVTGVICNRPPDTNTDGVSVILVKDTSQALMQWTHYILGKFGTKAIGIAGTSGKSITGEAMNRILSEQYSVHTALHEGNGRLSAPLSLAKLTPDHKFVVIKMGTNRPGELASIVEAVQPEIGIITHLGKMPPQDFETIDQVVEENATLIDYLSPTGLTVLNYDDDLVRGMAHRSRAPVKTVGMASFGADMMAYNIVINPTGTGFDLRYGTERYTEQQIPLFNQNYLYSIMAALIIGLHYEIPLKDSLPAVTQIKPLPGRMHPLAGIHGSLLIDDSHNADPQSTLAALDWLAAIKNKSERILFVFGDMDNLGRFSQIGHRQVGQRAAEVSDVIITQGTNAAITARAALDYGMDAAKVHMTYGTQDTVASLLNRYQLTQDDIVLLKGGKRACIEQVTKLLLANKKDAQHLVRQHTSLNTATADHPSRLTWVEINTETLANNVRLLKQHVGADVTLMAVVKANAYGHGAVVAAQTALLNGAEYLGVSTLDEAMELRAANISSPILTLNYVPAISIRQAIQHNITLTLYDLDLAKIYNRIARELNRKIRIHVKIDTGMGRLGTLSSDIIGLFRHLITMQHIKIEGIYTHFSTADTDAEYVQKQLAEFRKVIRPIQATTGIKFKYIHAANSAAILAHKDSHFSLVRPGLALYGMQPSRERTLPDGFQPAMTWKTIVIQVKTLPANHPIGYGNTYITKQQERVAILPIGYADGFRRAPHNWGDVLLHGQRARVIGRVSMEKTVVSIADIPNVAIGDEVVLLGRQGDEVITAEDIARKLGTINYEVTTAILPRELRR